MKRLVICFALIIYCFQALAQGRIVFSQSEYKLTTDSLFRLQPVIENFSPVDYRLINQPQGAQFDNLDGTFEWRPQVKDAGVTLITFVAIDSSGNEISKAVYLNIESVKHPPVITIQQASFDPDVQPIEIRERTDTVFLRISASDADLNEQLRYQFRFDGRQVPTLIDYTLDIIDEVLIFKWIPHDEEAEKKTYPLSIQVFDEVGLSDQLDLNFLVQDVNYPPEILNQRTEYEILPGTITNINIRAFDWDSDDLEFKLLNTGLSRQNFLLDETDGFLTINVPTREARNILKDGLELGVRVQEAENPAQYADITFQLKQAQTNLAPEVLISRTSFELQEGRPFNYRFRIFDANGNQDITAELRNPPEGLEVVPNEDGSYLLRWDIDFNYLQTNARNEEKRAFEAELVANDGELDSPPKKLFFTILNREDPAVLEDNFHRWKASNTRFISSMRVKSADLDKRSRIRRTSNRWLGFLGASVGAFGGLSATTKNGTFLNDASPFITFTSAIITGFVALRRTPSEYNSLSNELKRMQIELQSTQDGLERLSAQRMDKTFKFELGKAVDQLKKSTNSWVIQLYPQYSDLLKITGPELEFSKDRESSITFTNQ